MLEVKFAIVVILVAAWAALSRARTRLTGDDYMTEAWMSDQRPNVGRVPMCWLKSMVPTKEAK